MFGWLRRSGQGTRFAEPTLRDTVWQRGEGRCVICGDALTRLTFEADHRVAYASGGRTVASNLQILCRPCNQVKGGLSHDAYQRLFRQNGRAWRDRTYAARFSAAPEVRSEAARAVAAAKSKAPSPRRKKSTASARVAKKVARRGVRRGLRKLF